MAGRSTAKTSEKKTTSTNQEPKQVTERKQRPATTPEAREKQLVNLAVSLAEKQMMDGTASAAVITHFLKLGTEKEKLERTKLETELELIRAKANNLNKDNDMKELTEKALNALKSYGAQ